MVFGWLCFRRLCEVKAAGSGASAGGGKSERLHSASGWWDSFRRRHPYLALCTVSPLSYARVMGSDPAVVRKYFDLLERTLFDNHLLDTPSQIFNHYETEMPLNPSPPRLVAIRGMQNPSAVGSGDKS